MSAPVDTTYRRFQLWRRPFEIGFWVVTGLFNAVSNSITVVMDVRRSGLSVADWEPVVWTEADRRKGQAWGLKTIESFYTHGTPPVKKEA